MPEAPPQPLAPERRPAIVAVDDEPAVLAAVSRDLRRGFGERFRVLRATSGLEALDLLRQLRTRGGQLEIDLHDGIETTLVVLGHKLKHTTIEVVRNYDRDLPKLIVSGSELNQVWTNLLDNAIDALGGQGTITTRRDGDCAEIAFADDGPGIPAEIAQRIFDPFFTTKDIGDGTGLGLATARRIVVDQHDGSLSVDSEPGGGTTFLARLPLR